MRSTSPSLNYFPITCVVVVTFCSWLRIHLFLALWSTAAKARGRPCKTEAIVAIRCDTSILLISVVEVCTGVIVHKLFGPKMIVSTSFTTVHPVS